MEVLMRFKAVRASIGVVVGKTYSGSVVIRSHHADKPLSEQWRDIFIVVFNDLGKWHMYDATFFEPA